MYNKRYLKKLCEKYKLPSNDNTKQLVIRLLICKEVEEEDKKMAKLINMSRKELFLNYSHVKKSYSKERMIDTILNKKIPVKMFNDEVSTYKDIVLILQEYPPEYIIKRLPKGVGLESCFNILYTLTNRDSDEKVSLGNFNMGNIFDIEFDILTGIF